MSKGEVSEPKNKMTPEQLLKPRYKVIAPYPRSDSDGVKVGDILTDDGKNPVRNQHGDAIIPFHWEIFPHLFKPLAWYEERTKEEMPKYVKHIKMPEIVERVEAHFTGYFHNESGMWPYRSSNDSMIIINDKSRFTADRVDRQYYDYLPATETEYNQYLKTKQK